MSHDAEAAVLDQLQRIDVATGALRLASGLACPSGCGRCCLSPEVYATELELRPLARELWRRGAAAALLERLAAARDERRCALYEPDPADPARGRCAEYALRPGVCRLFGFAARRGRDGRLALAGCSVHREQDPVAAARAERAIADGVPAPELSAVHSALSTLEHGPTTRLRPINEALARALASVGLAERLAGDEAGEAEGPEPPEERPPGPSAPPRAA